MNVHQLGLFYGWVLRDLGLAPIDVLGFSFGGWIAAEMATANSGQFTKMALVAPMGIRPPEGELMDIFTVTIGVQLSSTVYDREATPEYHSLYGGGERSASRMEAFEDARTETARLGWEPILNNPGLPYFLQAVKGLPTQLIWGREDRVVPVSAATAYKNALANTDVRLAVFDECGHRPEIEKSAEFIKTMREFLA